MLLNSFSATYSSVVSLSVAQPFAFYCTCNNLHKKLINYKAKSQQIMRQGIDIVMQGEWEGEGERGRG